MYVLPGFDPTAANSGDIDVGNAEVDGKILLYNKSLCSLKLDFHNGNTDLLHAGEARWWRLDGDTPTIGWTIYSVVALLSVASEVTATLYSAHEEIPGTYPISITLQVNIGNSIALNSTSNGIINDGNANGTIIIEATDSTDTASAVVAYNNGAVLLGNLQGRLGSVQVYAGDNDVNHRNILDGTNGLSIAVGGVTLVLGSLKRIAFFSGACINGKVTVNHGLGVIPDVALVQFNLSSTPVAATIGANQATMTTTQVDVWSNVASNFVGVALKF
jgi:hypothetical protein